MKNLWSNDDYHQLKKQYASSHSIDAIDRLYTSRLLGEDNSLILHGGGNTSVKTVNTDLFGNEIETMLIKASGFAMKGLEMEGFTELDLAPLRQLEKLDSLTDDEMVAQIKRCQLDPDAAFPSVETLVNGFIPEKYIDHTHADAILVLCCQENGKQIIQNALGKNIILIDYILPGSFDLAKAVSEGYKENPNADGMVLMHHGLITWGKSAEASYNKTIELVQKAELFIEHHILTDTPLVIDNPVPAAKERLMKVLPVLRKALYHKSAEDGLADGRYLLRPVYDSELLLLLKTDEAKELLNTPPVTPDHLIWSKPFPMWSNIDIEADSDQIFQILLKEIDSYQQTYQTYLNKNKHRLTENLSFFDFLPKQIFIPGLGCICVGKNDKQLQVVVDITRQGNMAKKAIYKMGKRYLPLPDHHLFDMEYRGLQHKKIKTGDDYYPKSVAVITGAAGAIGSGICRELLEAGCNVIATDINRKTLQKLYDRYSGKYKGQIHIETMDVTSESAIEKVFNKVQLEWGGIDFLVINAGLAHVSPLEKMDIRQFRELERVNVEGTLFLLTEAAKRFKAQSTGGDIVLVSTKNVFAPGHSFGAYSATKAAGHQLARIASLELAPLNVRVNMVSPDAVFSDGETKSGLWQMVGPERMKARGLSEKGLEEYYQNRNLLKSRITASSVGRAVLFLISRQTPTTGATIPVDGGIPDAVPR